jgi:TonB-linked SusC/RagA family outer membrane protein
MKKILLLICTFCFLMQAYCLAQVKEVKGKITGAENLPLEGVGITVKGKGTGTLTDKNGTFLLRVPDNATLVLSFVGYKIKEISVKGRSVVNEQLESDGGQLDNVVVVGYQVVSRKSVTTSIASVSAKDIEPYATGTIATAIQGKLPGVQVMAANGTVGSQPRILVRGISSLTQNTNPLIIVDGMEIGYNNMNTINPSDVETLDVLKDASASAIYGARGGAGVILITTKKGKGKPVINFTSSTGIAKSPKLKLADANEYARVMNQIAVNSSTPLPFPSTTGLTNTDYWDQTFGNGGLKQDYNISARGGKEGLSLFGSLGYYNETSVAGERGGKWDKVTARLTGDLNLGKAFKIGISLSPRYERYPYAPKDPTYYAFSMDPTVAPYRTETDVMNSLPALTGAYVDFMTAFNPYYSLPSRSNYNGIISPEFYLRTNFDQRQYFGGQYSTYIEARPFKNLVLKTVLDGYAGFSQLNNYTPKYFFATNAVNTKTVVSSETSGYSRFKTTNTANYVADIGKHNINVLVGQSYDNYSTFGTNATRENIPFDQEAFRYINAGTLITEGTGGYQPGSAGLGGKMLSFFGSARYNYNEKYYLTGSMRADASSLVNPLYRWGYFPSLGAAWIVSEEPFFKNIAKTVSFLKVRADWGKSGGNLPGSVGAYISTVSPNLYVDANGNTITGYIPANIANTEIKWEVQQDYSIAFDAILLKDKLNITFEKFVRNPNNLLLPVKVDPVLGYPQGYYPTQYGNVGKLTTKGWDLAIGYKDDISRKIKLGVNLTLSHAKSVVDYLSTADPIPGNENNDVITTLRSRTTVGHEPGVWWGYYADGVFQTDAEAAAYVNKQGVRYQAQAKAGDLKFRDYNDDGVLDNKDLTDLGSPYPKFTSGLTVTLAYGDFDFRTELYGAFGQTVFNNYRRNILPSAHLNFLSGFADKYWNGAGSTNSFPILKITDPNGNFTKMSTFFLENGDFVKCNLIQLGYNVPPRLIKGIKSLRVAVSVQNAFTITKYTGLNPDVPWYSSVTYNGYDNYQMLVPRSFLFSANLTF